MRGVDAVVFDVDGVLVDTDASYGEAAVRTVQHFLVREAGLRDDGQAIDRATLRSFKTTGSWNNDWDLAQGLLCWLLAAPGSSTRELRSGAEPIAVAARRDLADLVARAGARAPWTWEEIRGVFEELYNGTAAAVDRYGTTPRLHVTRGLAENEPVLVRPTLFSALATLGIAKIGVVTGRNAADWEQVRHRLALPATVAVVTSDDGQKPDPLLLLRVVAALDARGALAVGDTLDDLRMAKAYLRTPHAARCPVTPVVLCSPDEEAAYRAEGARYFLRAIDDLPALVRTL